jgi:hypothetical protein
MSGMSKNRRKKGILEQRVLGLALTNGAAGGDVHHGRRDALDHGRQRRHRGFADGLGKGGVAAQGERGGQRKERGLQAGMQMI